MYSTVNNITKYKIEALADTSLRSCFSEYCIKLYDDYDLMYVDTAYKVSEGGIDAFKQHLAGYIEENIITDENTFYKVSFVSADVTEAVFASDDGYMPLESRILDFAKKSIPYASEEEALNYYIHEKLSYRDNAKAYSVSEYEIEYIASGSFEPISLMDDELKDGFFEITFDEYDYKETLFDELLKTPYDVKLKRLLDVIEINMKHNYSEYFEFSNLLESAKVTFYMDNNGKTYEITKQHTL